MQLLEVIATRSSLLAKASVSRQSVALAFLLAAGALLLFVGLGNRDFWPPDEPRYGGIAEELRSGVHGWRGLVLLHKNGEVYTQKPPLYFWLAALAGAPTGRVSEVAARLPSALAGFGTLLLVGWLGRALFRPRTGLLAALVLLTVPGWVQLARSARLDALLTGFVTLAFAAAWRLDRESGDARRNRLLLHAALGLGVLTKGPVALLLPLLGIVAYLAWERRLGQLRRFVSAPSLLLSVAPGVVWLAGATLLAPHGFVDVSFWENLIGRFFAGTSHARPLWFYVEALPRGFLPWTLLCPAIWWRYRAQRTAGERERTGAWRFLLAAVGIGLAFFSLSAGKRGVYLLPLYPLLAVAAAEVLAGWLEAESPAPRWLRRGFALGALALALAGLGTLVFDSVDDVTLPASFGIFLALGAALALLSERVLRAHTTSRIALAGSALGVLLAVELAVQVCLQPALNERNSVRSIAEAAAAATQPRETIGVYRNDTVAAGIGYYARRPVRELHEPRDVAGFFAQGGKAVVIEDRRLAELGRATRLREIGQGRCRQRLFHVLAPAG